MVPEGGSPYSSSTRVNGSAVELHEHVAVHVADANSAANSGQAPLGRPNPTSRTFAPQTMASESSRSAAGDDMRQVARNQTDSVCAPRYRFHLRVCDSDIRLQPHRGAGGQHNPTAPALSFSKSSALFAPRITESASTTTIPQSDDRATDRETHRVAKRTGLEGQSPYLNLSKSRNGSVTELHELRASANSAATSSQPPTVRVRPDPTSRTLAPQTMASESSRPAVGDDAGQVARYPTDVVCAPHYYFNPHVCVSDIQLQPRRGAGGLYSSVAASSSKSSLSRATQRGDVTPDFAESSPPAPVSGQLRTETNSHASMKTPKSSKLRVDSTSQREIAAHKVNQLHKVNSNISESSQNVELSSTPARQQDNPSPTPCDPQGEKSTYQANADPPRGAHSNISESQNVYPPSGTQMPAVQPVNPSPPPDAQGQKARYQAKVELPRGGNSNGSESQNVAGAQTSAGQQGSPAPKDRTGDHAKVPLRRAYSQKPESQDVDLPSVAHPSYGQQAPPPPWKDPPSSGKPLTASAPGVTKTQSSRQAQNNTIPGETQGPRVGTSPEVPVYPNERRESPPPDKKGGHDHPAPYDTPEAIKTESFRRTQGTTPGESQAPRERTPPELPVYSNESRVSVSIDKRGSPNPLSRREASNNVSSTRVRQQNLLPNACHHSNYLT